MHLVCGARFPCGVGGSLNPRSANIASPRDLATCCECDAGYKPDDGDMAQGCVLQTYSQPPEIRRS